VRFGSLGAPARAYVATIYLAAAIYVGWLWATTSATVLGALTWETFAVLALAAAVAHSFPVATPGRQAYHVSLPFFVAAIFLVHPLQLAILMIAVNGAEWARHWKRRSWVAQLFNVCTYVLVGAASQAVCTLTLPRPIGALPEMTAPGVLFAGAAVVVTYITINRVLVSLAIWLVNRIPPSEQYMFEVESILTEAVLLALGVPLALLTTVGPWALVLGSAPLFLTHRALDLPNLREQHRRDALTNLFTQSYLAEVAGREHARSRRFCRPLAMVLIDIDHLSRVNAHGGQQTGDAVIRGAARLIERAIREYDVAARLAGGRFVVLLPEAGREAAATVAERIRLAVAAHRFEVASSVDPLSVTVSCGVALADSDGETFERLFRAAEDGVARAKEEGRDRVVIQSASDVGRVASSAEGSGAFDRAESVATPPTDYATPRRTEPGPSQGRTAERSAAPSSRATDPARAGQLLVATVVAVAVGVVAWTAPRIATVDPVVLAVLVGVVVLAEVGPLGLWDRASYSLSTVPILAAGILLGVPGAVLVAPVSSIVRGVSRRIRWYKVAFNGGNLLIAAAAAAEVFALFGEPAQPANLVFLLVPAAIAGLVFYLHTATVALAVATEWRTNPVRLWTSEYRWLWPQYVVLAVMALLFALAYRAFGIIGAAAFVVPPLMMRYVAKQYVDKTLEHVRQLRGLNEQLQAEIAQRIAAEEANAQLASEAARAAALEELSRLKSEFISVASHELRTPMATVLGFSELLLDEVDPADPRHQYVSVIHQDAIQLSTLVNNLLDISRIETGRLAIELEPVDLEAVVRPLVTMLSAPAPRHDLVVELDPEARWVQGDAAKLNQILMNLVGNAIKYSPDGGDVIVRSAPTPDGRVLLSVNDQGMGIPEEHLEHIFERFYRVDSSETRAIPGTGLGLYIVRHLVELHGGAIVAESGNGRGTTFRFTLSAASQPAEVPSQPPAEAAVAT
jgi:diguanylate cyclase (GGDEF)-like protein